MKFNLILLLAILFILPIATAVGEIAIESVDSSTVKPGEITHIRIVLENQGKDDIENIAVSLDLLSDTLPFAPVGTAAEKIIEKIKDNKRETVNFQLIALPDAKPQIYKIPLKIRYDDTEEITVISVRVESQPILDLAIDESNVFMVGDTGEIIVRFVNTGLSDIKFLSAELVQSPDYEILSAPSFYIGNIEPDDFETASFNIYLNNKINFIPIKIEFRDSDNNFFTKTEFLDINIFSEEEARRLGLTKANNTPFIITTVILIIVILLIMRSLRKRKRAKKISL